MLLLKLLTLLKDEKVITNELTGIVEKSKTEYEFDEAIKSYIKTSPADFKARWANSGFAATKVSIWENLLKNYFHGDVELALQRLLQIKYADIVNNVDGIQSIYKEVAQDLAGSSFTYGNNIHKSIRGSVDRAFSNNRAKYRNHFKVFQNDPDINPAVLGDTPEPVRRVTDGMTALRNIPASEVKALLADLYNTRYLYRFDTDTSTHTYYSMYESFLRAFFRHEMNDFNKGTIQVVLSEHNENKYKKLDSIMESVFSDFIIPGISKDNLVEFQHTIFGLVYKETVTHTAPVFGQAELTGLGEEGNFNNGRTFASKGMATKKFDTFIKGFIALSKLYRYLREAGFTPYHIHADIFSFEFEDPSNKFLSLAEVVEFSSAYVQTRYKYKLKDSPQDFKALMSANNMGLLLPRNYEDVILANRNAIVLENLTNSVTNLTSKDANQCYATMHLPHLEVKANIFDLADFLSRDLNPLYAIFQGNDYEWDDDDTEEVWDTLAMQDYFSYLLKCDVDGFDAYEMKRETFLRMVESSQGELRDLFDDLTDYDLDVQIKILLALKDFVMEFKKFIDAFNDKYTKGVVYVSEVEYSTFLYKHPMFTALHDLVDPSVYRSRDDGLVVKVILTLLQKYYPELEMEQLTKFLNRNFKNVSYSNFIDSVQARTFKDITSYFHYAKANLFNLSEYGKPVCLNRADLTYALSNALPVIHLERFKDVHANVRQNSLGYLVDARGELYQVINEDNKTGALHSSGLYIFTDRTTKPWS